MILGRVKSDPDLNKFGRRTKMRLLAFVVLLWVVW